MAQKKIERLDSWPEWFTGKTINEPIFCREFLERHKLAYTENSFFTTEGRVTNEDAMRQTIYQQLEPFIVTGMSKKVDDIMKDLRIKAQVTGLLPQTDRVHVQNGTVFLDGSFSEAKNEIVRSRFPVRFNPKVNKPERWLKFLSELFLAGGHSHTAGIHRVLPDSQQRRTEDDGDQGQRRRRQEPDRPCAVPDVRPQREGRKRRKDF